MDPLTTAALISAGGGMLSQFMNKGGSDYQTPAPLPTYYQEYLSPEQKKLAEMLWPQMGKTMGGEAYDIPDIAGMMPEKGWYENLPEELKTAAWEPYEEGAQKLREMLGATGVLGSERAGMSGAAADIMGKYMKGVTPTVAANLWQMIGPAKTAGWEAGLEKAKLPSAATLGMLPQTFSDLLVGHTPTIQQIEPGAPMPPDYQKKLKELQGLQTGTQPRFGSTAGWAPYSRPLSKGW